MAFPLAHWQVIKTCKRCFMTLHTGERIWYRIHGFADLRTASGIQPHARISKEGDSTMDVGLYAAPYGKRPRCALR